MSASNVMGALRESLKRPGFIAVLVVLLLGAIGINGATTAMKLHFRKQAVDLRSKEKTLAPFPMEVGDWVAVPETHVIDVDVAHELQTDKYLFRQYVNTAAKNSAGAQIVTREKVKAMEALNERQRYEELAKIRGHNPGAVVSLAVTYYTGKVDTVPHVPDRCYVADGYQPSVYRVEEWPLGQYAGNEARNVRVRFIDFGDQTSRGATNRCVTYFFHANGKYEEDPLQVRRRLQNLFERYGYFAKIECMTVMPARQENDNTGREKDREVAATAMKSFLTGALPELEKLLPDWAEVQSRPVR